MPSIESMTFDNSWLEPEQESQSSSERRVWYTPDGDAVLLYFFDKAPDLPTNLRSVDQVGEMYGGLLAGSGAILVEAGVLAVARMRAVRTVMKVPQAPSGMTYIGSLTLPFRAFSYVLKVQCSEYGTTGLREAVLFDRSLQAGIVSFDPATGITGDWNPDHERHDLDFASHPVSRLRQVLRRIQSSIALDGATIAALPFPLPEPGWANVVRPPSLSRRVAPEAKPAWWQFWRRR